MLGKDTSGQTVQTAGACTNAAADAADGKDGAEKCM